MNEYVAEITLDLDCRKNTPIIAAGQFDKGRKCLIHITANDDAYSAAGATAVIKGRYHNKSYFSEECTVDNTGNVILTISEAILAVSGFVYAKIVLSDGAKTYSTQMFIIDVDDSLDGIISEFYNSKTTIITPESTHMQIPTAKAVFDAILLKADSETAVKIADAYETGATVPTGGVAENDALDINTIYRYHNTNGAIVANMICISRTEMTAQIRFAYDGGLRYRTYNSGTWSSWSLFATKAEVNSKVPNTRKIAGIELSDDVPAASLKTALSVPTKTSEITNDSGFVTDISGKADKATTLSGYGITDAYTKGETDNRISTAIAGVTGLSFQVVQSLPPIQGAQSNKIYLVPKSTSEQNDIYDEWAAINDQWEHLGTTQNDISGKVDKTQKIAGIDLQDDITATELKTALSVPTKTSDLTNDSGFLTAHQDISGKVDKTRKVAGVDLQDDITVAELQEALGVPKYLNDLTDGNVAVRKHIANSAPPTESVAAANTVKTPCLWYYDGDVWFVYGLTIVSAGYYQYNFVKLTAPTNVSAFTNDAGYLTAQGITGKMDLAQIRASIDDDTQVKQGQFLVVGGNVWLKTGAYGAAGHLVLEDQANKVSAIAASPTNTQYPSALAVKNYVDTVIGGVENGSY